MKVINYCLIILLGLGSVFCKKEEDPDPQPTPQPVPTGTLKLVFENIVDTSALNFTSKYLNAQGDTFKISKFDYYISNIVLTKADNSTFSEPNSYHLVKESAPGTKTITITNVPLASYKSIKLMLGVDSAKNAAGAGGGDLSQSNGMYWTWASGYIMLIMEGSAPVSGQPADKIEFHIGGYSGVNKVQRSFELNFGITLAEVTSTKSPAVHVSVNANEMFRSPNQINFSTTPLITTAGASAKMIADNYADMITFKQVNN